MNASRKNGEKIMWERYKLIFLLFAKKFFREKIYQKCFFLESIFWKKYNKNLLFLNKSSANSTMKIIRSEKHFFSSVTNLEDSNLYSYLNVHQPRQFVLLDEPVRLGFLNIQSDRVYGKNPIRQGFLKYLKLCP